MEEQEAAASTDSLLSEDHIQNLEYVPEPHFINHSAQGAEVAQICYETEQNSVSEPHPGTSSESFQKTDASVEDCEPVETTDGIVALEQASEQPGPVSEEADSQKEASLARSLSSNEADAGQQFVLDKDKFNARYRRRAARARMFQDAARLNEIHENAGGYEQAPAGQGMQPSFLGQHLENAPRTEIASPQPWMSIVVIMLIAGAILEFFRRFC